jgi:hypothetical protein
VQLAISETDAAVRARLTQPPLREESTKISTGGIVRGRYLLTFSRRALLPGPAARFQALANDLGLDASALTPHVSAANAVHVGMEPGGRTKLYLEFPPPAAPTPHLAFLAVKHDNHINRYNRIDHLRVDQQTKLLCDTVPESAARTTALACLSRAGGVLQVTEESSARNSIDIHLADAAMTVGDLPELDALLRGHGDDLSDIRSQQLGHFACGIGRDGAAFATIYYGGRHDP